ncbi:hypothetical protein [Streptomyces sp. DW26H14]
MSLEDQDEPMAYPLRAAGALEPPVAELRRIEGLVVGGLREVPVRW